MTSDTVQLGLTSTALEETGPTPNVSSEDTERAFPTDTLPPRVKAFVEECAKSLPVPPDLVALPAIVTVGVSIGSSRFPQGRLRDESASLYGAIARGDRCHEKLCPKRSRGTLTGARMRVIERTRPATLPLSSSASFSTQIHEVYSSFVTNSLHGSSRSISIGMGEERTGNFIFPHGAPSRSVLTVKARATAGSRTCVPHPFLAVIGCIPPDVLSELQERGGQQDGFIERILFAWPEPVPTRWTDAAVSAQTREGYEGLLQELLKLDGRVPLQFTPEALRRFQEWVDTPLCGDGSPQTFHPF